MLKSLPHYTVQIYPLHLYLLWGFCQLKVSLYTSISSETFAATAQCQANFTLESTVRSDTAWPQLSAEEPAVLWELLCQLALEMSDPDQNEAAAARWPFWLDGIYRPTVGLKEVDRREEDRMEEEAIWISLEISSKANSKYWYALIKARVNI